MRNAEIDTADLDARLIVGHVLGFDMAQMIANEREPVSARLSAEISVLVERRLAGEPVARIRGFQEFYGLRFDLGPDALVPRPDTELLVDLAEAFLKTRPNPTMLDIGTGTGCIPIALLHEMGDLTATATDLSQSALDVAQANAKRHHVADRMLFHCGSWFAPLPADARYDVITSNPPYIATPVIAGLATEVREHDPALALDGGADGLVAYRQILASAPAHLRPGGRLIFEIGHDQATEVSLICRQSGLHEVGVYQDIAGLDRAVVAHC